MHVSRIDQGTHEIHAANPLHHSNKPELSFEERDIRCIGFIYLFYFIFISVVKEYPQTRHRIGRIIASDSGPCRTTKTPSKSTAKIHMQPYDRSVSVSVYVPLFQLTHDKMGVNTSNARCTIAYLMFPAYNSNTVICVCLLAGHRTNNAHVGDSSAPFGPQVGRRTGQRFDILHRRN